MWYDLNNVDLRNAKYLLFPIRIHIKKVLAQVQTCLMNESKTRPRLSSHYCTRSTSLLLSIETRFTLQLSADITEDKSGLNRIEYLDRIGYYTHGYFKIDSLIIMHLK